MMSIAESLLYQLKKPTPEAGIYGNTENESVRDLNEVVQ